MGYRVEIVETATDEVVETVGDNAYRTAERIERGININLNHEKFYTRIKGD